MISGDKTGYVQNQEQSCRSISLGKKIKGFKMNESQYQISNAHVKGLPESDSYKQMATIYKGFKEIQTRQKQRGLNDFNLFTTLLNKTDEVRLHSRFLASLLNPKGFHYQDSLFLEIFLALYKPIDFSFEVSNASVYREHENIDLYLSDGNNHIIIENKIYASDQKAQIERYIKSVQGSNPEANDDEQEMNIWVIYLTIDRERPSAFSLGNYQLNTELSELSNGSHKTFYSNLHYSVKSKYTIMKWLNSSLAEVENLQDLSFAIKQYVEVVEKLTGNYRSKVMTLTDYINELSFEDRQAFLITASEVTKALPDLKNQQVEQFFNQLQMRCNEFLPADWSVEMRFERLSKKWGYPFRLHNPKNELWIALEFNKKNYNSIRIGVVRKKQSINIAQVISNEDIQHQLKPLRSKYKKFPQNEWWLTYESIKMDLWAEILKHGEEHMLNLLENRFKQLVEDFAAICDLTRKEVDQNSP